MVDLLQLDPATRFEMSVGYFVRNGMGGETVGAYLYAFLSRRGQSLTAMTMCRECMRSK